MNGRMKEGSLDSNPEHARRRHPERSRSSGGAKDLACGTAAFERYHATPTTESADTHVEEVYAS